MSAEPPASLDDLIAHLRLDNPAGTATATLRDYFATGAGALLPWASGAVDECNEHLCFQLLVCAICGNERETGRLTCANHDPELREEWEAWSDPDPDTGPDSDPPASGARS